MRSWLKELRKNRKLTQQNVADLLGITRQYYQMIESCERQRNMDIALLTKLSEIFQISLIKLVKLESEVSTAYLNTVVSPNDEKVNSNQS